MKKIVDSITVAYNAKVAEEKKRDGGNKKKGKEKPKIQAGKAADNTRNNNPAMVQDLIGDDYGDEYGEYGDYGDESGAGAAGAGAAGTGTGTGTLTVQKRVIEPE